MIKQVWIQLRFSIINTLYPTSIHRVWMQSFSITSAIALIIRYSQEGYVFIPPPFVCLSPISVIIKPPPLIGGALSDDAVWRLTSVAYIGPKSRTERPGKTKIGTEVAHVTRDSDTTFKVKVTRPLYSPRVNASASCSGERWERIERDNLLLYVAVCRRVGRLGGARRFGALRGRRGAGHIVAAARLQLVIIIIIIIITLVIVITVESWSGAVRARVWCFTVRRT